MLRLARARPIQRSLRQVGRTSSNLASVADSLGGPDVSLSSSTNLHFNTEDTSGRRLVRQLVRTLEAPSLDRLVALAEREAASKNRGKDGEPLAPTPFLRKCTSIIAEQPILLSLLGRFLQGTAGAWGTTPTNFQNDWASNGSRQLIDPDLDTSSEFAEVLLRLRATAPRAFGSYTAVPDHLKLAPRVFGVLQEADTLEPDAVTPTTPASSLAAAFTPHDMSGAVALALRLESELPVATMRSLRSELLAAANTERQQKRSRQRALTRLVSALGHHWAYIGPDLCRFLCVYDASAERVCPFRAEAEDRVQQLESRILGPLLILRSRAVTPLVKAVGSDERAPSPRPLAPKGALQVAPVGELDPDVTFGSSRMQSEMQESGAEVRGKESTGSATYVPMGRRLKLSMVASCEEDALLTIAQDPSSRLAWAMERTVIARNLPEGISDADIVESFQRCGAVKAVHVFNRQTCEMSRDEVPHAVQSERGTTEDAPVVVDEAWEKSSEEEEWEVADESCNFGMNTHDTTAPSVPVAAAVPAATAAVAEEAGLSSSEVRRLRTARKQAAKAEAKAAREIKGAAQRAAREEARVEAARARREAAQRPGRKKGLKSVLAAKNAADYRRDSGIYAFVEFEDESGATRAAGQAARIFGVALPHPDDKRPAQMCRTGPASEARTLHLYALDGSEATASEVEQWLNESLEPLVHVHIQRARSTLWNEVAPNTFQVDFPSHEAAAWAFRRLDGSPMRRPLPLHPALFGVQWLRVAEAVAKGSAGVLYGWSSEARRTRGRSRSSSAGEASDIGGGFLK